MMLTNDPRPETSTLAIGGSPTPGLTPIDLNLNRYGEHMQPKVLILGMGNLLVSDEGLGVCALALLQDRYLLPSEVQCVDGGVLGLELMAYLDGVTHLLAIDAVQNGEKPGTLVRLEGDEIPKNLDIKLSMHQVSFANILALSQLQGTIPPELVVLGLVPSSLETGVGLSPIVAARLELLIAEVLRQLHHWGLAVEARAPNGFPYESQSLGG